MHGGWQASMLACVAVFGATQTQAFANGQSERAETHNTTFACGTVRCQVLRPEGAFPRAVHQKSSNDANGTTRFVCETHTRT